ncbi:hypothetical protein BG015_001410 [Linnemannia schmuckeri]|uniref:Ig-like domain-containing protein n=1 Tax=Linnemannia schmuckeri TaxID=64567 RepID=A0A9P5V6H5_9FUNG|nr:hypothetical protein BG015_001410 [Linnemannia schmuckeri]
MRPQSLTFLPLPSTILLLLALTSTPTLTQASITCDSPTSGTTIKPGDSLTFRWGDSGSYPKSADVYSADATVSCSSGSQIAKVTGITNGQGWTVPRNVLDTCEGGELEVQLSGSHYDLLHWAHWYSFEARCGNVEVEPEPVTTTTTTTATTTTTTTTSVAPVTTVTTATVTTPTLSTATLSVTPTPTVNGTLPGILPPSAPGLNPQATTNLIDPSSPSSTSSSSSSSSDSSSKSGGGPSKAALGALGAVGGLAALAVLIFGFILVKRRQRRRAREQRWMDHNYSSTSMSDRKGSGGFSGSNKGGNDYAFSGGVGPGAGGAAGLSYLEDQRDGYTAYHNPDTISSASHHVQSTEYVIPQPAPPADKNNDDDNKQQQMLPAPVRPARTYQGDFDDPTTPWDGQLGYPQLYPSQQQGAADANVDLGYEYIRDYIPSDPTYQQDMSNNTNNTNHNRQLSMRASSQLPADLEYFAQLREASWPMPPTSPTRGSQHQQQSTVTLTTGQKPSSSPTQMPYLIPLARTLSHSGAHQYDGDATGTSSSRCRGDADAATAPSTGGGDQLLALNGDSADIDIAGDGNGGGNASTAA